MQISFKFVCGSRVNYFLVLVQMLACHQTGDKPLYELKLAKFTLGPNELTHWGRDKMTTIFQTTFSDAFSWMKM